VSCGLLDRRIVGTEIFRALRGLHESQTVDELVPMRLGHLLITTSGSQAELSFPEAYGEELEVLGP